VRKGNLKRVHLIISGVVQGVGFRYYSQREAKSLTLSGYVRNLDNGSVEIEAQGTERSIERFITWAKHGPRNAKVESFTENDIDIVEGEIHFEIR
jgi:acylphosphatase